MKWCPESRWWWRTCRSNRASQSVAKSHARRILYRALRGQKSIFVHFCPFCPCNLGRTFQWIQSQFKLELNASLDPPQLTLWSTMVWFWKSTNMMEKSSQEWIFSFAPFFAAFWECDVPGNWKSKWPMCTWCQCWFLSNHVWGTSWCCPTLDFQLSLLPNRTKKVNFRGAIAQIPHKSPNGPMSHPKVRPWAWRTFTTGSTVLTLVEKHSIPRMEMIGSSFVENHMFHMVHGVKTHGKLMHKPNLTSNSIFGAKPSLHDGFATSPLPHECSKTWRNILEPPFARKTQQIEHFSPNIEKIQENETMRQDLYAFVSTVVTINLFPIMLSQWHMHNDS